MMLFLIHDILIHLIDMRMRIRKCSKALLPRKFAVNKFLIIYKIARIVFDIPD